MDVLLKQTRARFSGLGQGNKEDTSSNRERRIPPQKTQTFKGEKRRSQNWFSRQFSRQMSRDDYDDYEGDGEYAMAVAASAFAINSLMEELTMKNTNQRKLRERQDSITSPSQPSNKVSPRISGTEEPTRNVGQAPSLKKSPTFQDKKSPSVQSPKPQSGDLKPDPLFTKQSPFPDKNKLGSANPPLTKQLTFPGMNKLGSANPQLTKQLTFPDMDKPGSAIPPLTKQLTFPDKDKPGITNPPLTKQLSFPGKNKPGSANPPEIRKSGSVRAKAEETRADKWEKAEMIKIKERYASRKNSILDWENKKKEKARNKERTESEVERKRSKAMQKYREQIDRIEKIAGGARVQADKNERKEMSKVKDKANKIRETGKLPATCLCF